MPWRDLGIAHSSILTRHSLPKPSATDPACTANQHMVYRSFSTVADLPHGVGHALSFASMKAFRRPVMPDWLSVELGGKRRHFHRRSHIVFKGWEVTRWSSGKGVLKDQCCHLHLLCQETRARYCFLFLGAGVNLFDRIVECPVVLAILQVPSMMSVHIEVRTVAVR